jgi:hypothetical protein
MKYLKKYKIFEYKSVFNISEININLSVLFKGIMYKVIDKDDFSITLMSDNGSKKLISQYEINQYGIFIKE